MGVAGTTSVGVVTGVSSGERDLKVNDVVLVVSSGLWSDEVVVSRDNVSKLSSSNPEEAATLPSFLSAWGILHNSIALTKGDVIVQSSGNSATGTAISQIGKALGFTVVSPTSAELADPKFVSNLKTAHQVVRLAVSDQSGRVALDLSRCLAENGALVYYNGRIESLANDSGVDVPAANTIYKNTSISGFDLGTWHATDPSGFQAALSAVQALGNEKKIGLKPKVYAVADYKKALTEVENTGSAAVLKF